MYLTKLRFFKEDEAIKNQNRLSNMNLMAANLKNYSLRRRLAAYLRDELEQRLAKNKKTNQDKARRIRLLARLKYLINKRQARKRLLVRHDYGRENPEVSQRRITVSRRQLMR